MNIGHVILAVIGYFIACGIFGKDNVNGLLALGVGIGLLGLALGGFINGMNSLEGTTFLFKYGLYSSPYLSLLVWLGIIIGLVIAGILTLNLLKLTFYVIKHVIIFMTEIFKSIMSIVWLLWNRESRFLNSFNSISFPILQSMVIDALRLFKVESAQQRIAQNSLSRRLEIVWGHITSYKERLDTLNEVNWALGDDEVFHQFFCYCNKSHKLYLILDGLGYGKDRYTSKQCSAIIEYYVPHTRDAQCAGTNDLKGVFSDYWEKALASKISRTFTLAYLLNRSKFDKFKSTLIVTTNPSEAIEKIKHEYSLKKLNAKSKAEVERLLDREKDELRNVYSSDLFNDCEDYVGDVKPVLYDLLYSSSFDPTKSIVLTSLTEENRISFDFSKDTARIQDELKDQLAKLKDSDSIMKAKSIASQSISKLVDWSRLGYTLETAVSRSVDFDKTNNAIALAFKSKNYHLIKAALAYIYKSYDPRWVGLIPSYSTPGCISPMIAKALSNKSSLRALNYIASIKSSTSWERVLEGDFSNAVFSDDGKLAYANSSIYKLHDWVRWYKIDDFISFSAAGGVILSRSGVKRIASKKTGISDPNKSLLSISHDEKWYTTTKAVHDLNKNKHVASIESPIKVFSPDNKWMATHKAIYSTKNWKVHYELDTKGIYNLDRTAVAVFSPDSKWFSNGKKLIWVRKKNRWSYSGKTPCFSPDSKWYADSERLINLEVSRKKKTYHVAHTFDIKGISIGFSNDSQLYACDNRLYSLSPDENGSIYYDNLPSTFQCFSNDSLYLATTNEIIWIKTMKTLIQFKANNARFSPDGYFIAVSDGLYLTNKLQLLLVETAMNSLLSIKDNLNDIKITELIQIKKNLSSKQYFQGLSEEINHLIELKGRSGNDISLDKRNRDESTDISIGG